MEALVKNKMALGLKYDRKSNSSFCESCVQGKSHRLPFEQSAEKRAEQPLDLVHSDLCGKVGTRSLSGCEYFITFIDDHTRHLWVYILKHKSEVFQRFQEWKALVETASGRKIKTLRSDNGGEYTSTEFAAFMAKEGIRHEFTIPHTPQQNGVAERLNRTLIEGVRTMLADSRLPHRFWAEALSTCVYLRNRSPTKAVTGVTPYEAWSGTKPDVSHLRVCGCSAYALVPKVERSKLDSKTRKCVLLGYGSNQIGYRLYDLDCKKVVHSRDVTFDEASTPGVEKEVASTYVELEINEESTTRDSDDLPDREQLSEDSPVSDTSDRESDPRRSARPKQKPDWYSHSLNISAEHQDPRSLTEVKSSSDRVNWERAMNREMESLKSNQVWELVEPPSDRKIIGSKWVFKRKIDANGVVERHKARLVAQGCTQKFGLDYEETFSPVVRFESIRTVVALGAQQRLQLHQMDVSTAFLHGELTEEVYMRQPEGFVEPGKEHLVCCQNRSIYGLKQPPRCWNHVLDNRLKEMGFKQTPSDPCLYVHTGSEGVFIVAVYVDDIVLGGRSEAKMTAVKEELSQKFQMKDLGPLHHFLRIKVVQDRLTGAIWIGKTFIHRNGFANVWNK